MKTRIFSGIATGLIAIIAIVLIDTPVYAMLVSAVSAIATYEILKVAKVTNKLVSFSSIVFSAFVPIYLNYKNIFESNLKISTVLIIYILLLLIFMLLKFDETKFEHVTIAVFSSTFIAFSFSIFILLRDIDKEILELTHKEGLYFVLFGLLCSSMTDTFAYFVGSKFGKHKLCPKISPKKTVEGAIGGIIGAVILNLIIFHFFKKVIIIDTNISYFFIIIMSIVLSIISMLGDLSASTIKRNYSAKDFGNLIPGHGGIMDRLDSSLFVLPALYAVIQIIY